jgi:hypothetical protein
MVWFVSGVTQAVTDNGNYIVDLHFDAPIKVTNPACEIHTAGGPVTLAEGYMHDDSKALGLSAGCPCGCNRHQERCRSR